MEVQETKDHTILRLDVPVEDSINVESRNNHVVMNKNENTTKRGRPSKKTVNDTSHHRKDATKKQEPKKRKVSNTCVKENNEVNGNTTVQSGLIDNSNTESSSSSSHKKKSKKEFCDSYWSRNKTKESYQTNNVNIYIAEEEGFNEKDTDSVKSGLLEEDICYQCGLSTFKPSEKVVMDNVILCDVCDGEYHLQCLGLESVPEVDDVFVCLKCQEEEEHMKGLDFGGIEHHSKSLEEEVIILLLFLCHSIFIVYCVLFTLYQITTDKHDNIDEEPPGICYSPPKPLSLAIEECKTKGFMVVSRVLPYNIMRSV
jgi:hypothetical protein